MVSPILFAIATFRYFNPHTPVYVLDVSTTEQDWEDYPNLLNFKIICTKSLFKHNFINAVFVDLLPENLKRDPRIIPAWKVYDVSNFANNIPEDRIIFSDSDIFWLNKLNLNYTGNKFCCNKNTGFFYYNKSGFIQEFFTLWQTHTLLMMLGKHEVLEKFREKTIFSVPEPNEEITFQYLLSEYPQYVELCREHPIYGYSADKYGFAPISLDTCFIHFAGSYMPAKNRLVPFFLFQEYNKIIRSFGYLYDFLIQLNGKELYLSVYDKILSKEFIKFYQCLSIL